MNVCEYLLFLGEGPSRSPFRDCEIFASASLHLKLYVQGELEEIQTMVEDRRRVGRVSVRSLVTEARYAKPLGLVLVLMLLQQLSGINYILGYSTTIMQV